MSGTSHVLVRTATTDGEFASQLPIPQLHTMSFISLANQVKQSKGLFKFLKPLADTYAKTVGHRKYGLRYDDLREYRCLTRKELLDARGDAGTLSGHRLTDSFVLVMEETPAMQKVRLRDCHA